MALLKNEEQKVWEFYCHIYTEMKEKISFPEFLDRVKEIAQSKNLNQLSETELIKLAESIKLKHQAKMKK